ncbi:hypothetical protein [Streptomyces sp. NPDC049744]|uniref:hypothetical protein n=1 Tax=Streptomyces sp. NPDC049744 TaxID=3154359 RepID=UPI003417A881
MTTDLGGAQRELEDARRERAELDELIGALEGQVRDGEAADAARELTAQYGLQRLAQLRAEAAEQRVRDAEAAELAGRRELALAEAERALGAVSGSVLAGKYAAALAALDDLTVVCKERDEATRRHLGVFRELGMTEQVVVDEPHQQIIEVGRERFEVGMWTPERIVTRVVGRLAVGHRLRELMASTRGFGGVHDLDVAVSGLPVREARDAEAAGRLPGVLLRAVRRGGGETA